MLIDLRTRLKVRAVQELTRSSKKWSSRQEQVKLIKMNIADHPAIPGADGHPVDTARDRFVNGQTADASWARCGETGHPHSWRNQGKTAGEEPEEQDLLKADDEALRGRNHTRGLRSTASAR